jgi:hypothetical protein
MFQYFFVVVVLLLSVFYLVKKNKKNDQKPSNESIKKPIWKSLDDFQPLIPPRDVNDKRFIHSFDLKEENEILSFLDKYGFVVIKNILSEEEVNETVSDIWDNLELKYGEQNKKVKSTLEGLGVKTVDRNDKTTWEIQNGWSALTGYFYYIILEVL